MGPYGAMGTYGVSRIYGAVGTYGVKGNLWGHGDLWGGGRYGVSRIYGAAGAMGQLTGARHVAQHFRQLQQQSCAHPRGRRPRPQRITTRPHDDVTIWGAGPT